MDRLLNINEANISDIVRSWYPPPREAVLVYQAHCSLEMCLLRPEFGSLNLLNI